MGYSIRSLGLAFRSSENKVFGRKIGIVGRVFGCYHPNLSRPFNRGKVSFRTCLHCGARKKFDTDSLVTYGAYYYPPESAIET